MRLAAASLKLQSKKEKTNNNIATTEHNYKQQQQQNEPQNEPNQHDPRIQTTFQQLNLQGDNIDEQDGEDFADTMTTKGPDKIRVISQNVNSVPEQARKVKSKKIVHQVCSGNKADIWMLQEIGLCWDKVHKSDQWSERTSCLLYTSPSPRD